MPQTRGFAGAMIALLGLAGSAQLLAQARETTVVSYDCNLDGAPAQLVAQVETVRPAGVFMGSDGRFGGAIDSGEVNYYYQGTLSSASARYSFTGENQFADFVDMTNNERFRAVRRPGPAVAADRRSRIPAATVPVPAGWRLGIIQRQSPQPGANSRVPPDEAPAWIWTS
jgi:hypothetical protein